MPYHDIPKPNTPSYTDVSKPSNLLITDYFLLINSLDYFLINTVDKLIISETQVSIYHDIIKPTI